MTYLGVPEPPVAAINEICIYYKDTSSRKSKSNAIPLRKNAYAWEKSYNTLSLLFQIEHDNMTSQLNEHNHVTDVIQ